MGDTQLCQTPSNSQVCPPLHTYSHLKHLLGSGAHSTEIHYSNETLGLVFGCPLRLGGWWWAEVEAGHQSSREAQGSGGRHFPGISFFYSASSMAK